MRQILFLHGGNSFSTYPEYLHSLRTKEIEYEQLKFTRKWRDWLAQQLPDDDVLIPTMPNGFNAQYDEWKIYFEKILPFLMDDVTIMGHSLGAMFLAKYLEETSLPKTIHRIILIAGRYGGPEDENGSFHVTSSVHLPENAHEVHLFHSKDDPVVPYEDMAKFKHDMPDAIIHSFTDRGHFNDSTFPEMHELLKQK
jgi:predicted alpha/beta hydrolase family esterase